VSTGTDLLEHRHLGERYRVGKVIAEGEGMREIDQTPDYVYT
jgi:hypothetical protein